MDFIVEENRIFSKDGSGKTTAEVLFPHRSPGAVTITRTFVDDSLRGQGIAGKLMELTCEKLRRDGKKAYPVCSYAVKWFGAHPECGDVLVDGPDSEGGADE